MRRRLRRRESCATSFATERILIVRDENMCMGWLRCVVALKLQVSFAKEPCKRDDILQKRPMILRSLLIVASPYDIVCDGANADILDQLDRFGFCSEENPHDTVPFELDLEVACIYVYIHCVYM